MKEADGRKGALGVIENAWVRISGGKISAIGSGQAPKSNDKVVDAQGKVVMPAIVECHTHLVHAGSRANEFAMRSRGETYESIAKSGGGIMSTVKATREATEDELLELAAKRLAVMISHGVGTVEVKSGYGLDKKNELKILRVAKKLGSISPVDVVSTFLGAHSIPAAEIARKNPKLSAGEVRKKYLSLVINEMIPAVADEKLATFCDVFADKIAFTKDEARRVLEAGLDSGLLPKLHADQLSDSDGAELAADIGAVSADHLEHATIGGLKAMKKAGVAAVLIPCSTFFVGGKYAPAREMLKMGLPVAISTDYNPGTSPILNPWLAASIAITQMKLTVEEALCSLTLHAAAALKISDAGFIDNDAKADLIILSTDNEAEALHRPDVSFVSKVIKGGVVIF